MTALVTKAAVLVGSALAGVAAAMIVERLTVSPLERSLRCRDANHAAEEQHQAALEAWQRYILMPPSPARRAAEDRLIRARIKLEKTRAAYNAARELWANCG